MKEFKSLRLLRKARKFAGKACNNCLGRQFARVSTGMTNRHRGQLIRGFLKTSEPQDCLICGGLFRNLEKFAAEARERTQGIEFSTFLVGSRLSGSLLEKEEGLWEEIGIEDCEPLKGEINRELGKVIAKSLNKKPDEKSPDVVIFLDLGLGRVEIMVSQLFIYGLYKKLVRGLPQTKWDTYPETVEDIIARPFMMASGAVSHSMHAAGREDIDARCLDWRPFVLELGSPKRRSLGLKKLELEINRGRKVRVSGLRVSNKKEVRVVKSMRPDKTYRALVAFEAKPNDLKSLKGLVGIISQKTPARVLHRRADLLRKRKVKQIKFRKSGKGLVLEVRAEAGLYIKELISGDGGRTSPSVAGMLGPCKAKELDVIKIHLKGKS